MKVKVRCLKNTYPVGLRWGFISKTPPLNPLKVGTEASCCSPRRHGKPDCCKSSFAAKPGMLSYHGHLCSWREASPLGGTPSSSKLLPSGMLQLLVPLLPPAVCSFSQSIFVRVCRNVSVHIWAWIPPVDSTSLFSLGPCDAYLLHIVLQLGNNLPQVLLARNSLTSYSTMWELLILELVQGWAGRCPQLYQDAVQFHSPEARGQHCKNPCGYIMPVVTDRMNSCCS